MIIYQTIYAQDPWNAPGLWQNVKAIHLTALFAQNSSLFAANKQKLKMELIPFRIFQGTVHLKFQTKSHTGRPVSHLSKVLFGFRI